jgi:uncharacterized protein (AIM24 family)
MTQAHGPGRIAFSRDGTDHVFGILQKPRETLDVREHQFLAAPATRSPLRFSRVKGVDNMLLGGTVFFIDTFSCERQDGILWLHVNGNVF